MSNKEKEVNIYLIKNDKTKDGQTRRGGQFYNVYTSEGNIGDISEYSSLTDNLYELEESLRAVDPTFKRSGGIIVKLNVKIKSVSMFGENAKFKMVSMEEAARKAREIEKLNLINKKRMLLAEIERTDDRLERIQTEEEFAILEKTIKL